MTSSSVNKMDENDVFNRWIADVREDMGSRFGYQDRKLHLENLMGYLKMHNIPMDDAMFLKKRVVETLVTKEGMKGKGKHSGWKENTEADFDDAIQKTYVPGLVESNIRPTKTAQGYDPNIMAWIKAKYPQGVREDFIIAAHQPMHFLWLMFIKDHFKRENL